MGCLYLITSPSNREYIGITAKTAGERWSDHLINHYSKRGALYSAMRKYGHAQFRVETLLIANDWSYLCEMERRAIKRFGSRGPHGYNMTSGGDGVSGLDADTRAEHRKRTSAGTLKAWKDPEHRARQIQARARPETKERMRASSIKSAVGKRPEVKAKLEAIRNAPEYRANISAKIKGLWANPEYRARMMSKRRNRSPRTEESKRLQSEKMKAYIADRKKAGTYWL